MTPNLVAGAWVGGEDRSIHFRDMTLGQGARMAMPIWALFMQKVNADTAIHIVKGRFPKPKNFSVELDCDKYAQKTNSETYTDTTQLHYKNKIPEGFF